MTRTTAEIRYSELDFVQQGEYAIAYYTRRVDDELSCCYRFVRTNEGHIIATVDQMLYKGLIMEGSLLNNIIKNPVMTEYLSIYLVDDEILAWEWYHYYEKFRGYIRFVEVTYRNAEERWLPTGHVKVFNRRGELVRRFYTWEMDKR